MAVHAFFLKSIFLERSISNTVEMLMRPTSIKLGATHVFATLCRMLAVFLISSMFFQIQCYENNFHESRSLQKERRSALSKDVPGSSLAKTKPSLMQ